jgi:serine protease inhibitor
MQIFNVFLKLRKKNKLTIWYQIAKCYFFYHSFFFRQEIHSKVNVLLFADLFSDSTSLVVTNAIYFKALWKTAFRKDNTKEDAFYVQRNVHKLVPTMHLKHKLRTGKLRNLDSQWLEVPFQVSTKHSYDYYI